MIAFYTRFQTTAENRNVLVSLLSEASAAMDSVERCKRYDITLDAQDPCITSVFEIWEDEAAHDAALQLPEARELISQAMPLMTEKPQQAKLGPVLTHWL